MGLLSIKHCENLTTNLSWFYVFKLHDYIKFCSANIVQYVVEIVYNIMTYELSCSHLIHHWLLHVTSIELRWNYNKVIRQYKWFSVVWPTSLPYGKKWGYWDHSDVCVFLSVCAPRVSHHFMLQKRLLTVMISSTDITPLETTHCHYFTLFTNKITPRVH